MALLFERWRPTPPHFGPRQKNFILPVRQVRVPLSANPVPHIVPHPALPEPATVHGVSCTLRIGSADSGRRTGVSRLQALTDGRYRQERSDCVVVFDGTTLWMIPKAHGPVLRSGPQPTMLGDMLAPAAALLGSWAVSTRPVEHAGRPSLAVEVRRTPDAHGAYDELTVDAASGIAVYWRDGVTGRQAGMSALEWDPALDESLFHAELEAAHTVVRVGLV